MDTFKLKDGREVKVDFASFDSVSSISKPDWKEIKTQLDEYLRIVCSQLTNVEVFNLLRK